MRTTTTISVFRHEQPAPDVWESVERVLADWERAGGAPVDRQVEFIRMIELTDPADRATLVGRLEDLGAAMHVVRRDVLEPADYREADYVGIFGVDLGPGFVDDAPEQLRDAGPCLECGQHDVLDVEQTGPFVVDDQALDRPAIDGSGPGPDGWQVVGLPGGGLAVSRPVADSLADLEGVVLRDLLTVAGPSRRLAQLESDRPVLVPCRVHTDVDGPPHCTTCGRARGQVRGPVFVSTAQTADRDLISSHRGGRAFLFLSRPALDDLERLAPSGLWVHGVLRVCNHWHLAPGSGAGDGTEPDKKERGSSPCRKPH